MKKTIKKSIKKIIHFGRGDDLFLKMSHHKIRILMYHQISPKDISAEAFEFQMEFIRKHFDSYWLCEIPSLLEKMNNGFKPARPVVVITFDDGYRNQIYKAFPIMAPKKIKSTVFLLAEPQGGMLWNHDLACRLPVVADHDLMKICAQNNFPFLRKSDPQAVKNLIEQVKTWRKERREEFLDLIRQMSTHFTPAEWMKDEYELISKQDIKNIDPKFVEIGCHTFEHHILNQVDDACAYREIVESKKKLEELIARPVQSFCYPNGDYSKRDLELVQKHYSSAVAGLGFAGKNPFLLKRIAAHANFEDFKWSLISAR